MLIIEFIGGIAALCVLIGVSVFIPAWIGFKTCRWILAGSIVTFIACFAVIYLGKFQHQTYSSPEYDMEKIVENVEVDEVIISDTNAVEYITFFDKEYYVYYVTPTPTPIPHPEWLAEEK